MKTSEIRAYLSCALSATLTLFLKTAVNCYLVNHDIIKLRKLKRKNKMGREEKIFHNLLAQKNPSLKSNLHQISRELSSAFNILPMIFM